MSPKRVAEKCPTEVTEATEGEELIPEATEEY